jgi:tetratricopeptide (TPR) repeat protein
MMKLRWIVPAALVCVLAGCASNNNQQGAISGASQSPPIVEDEFSKAKDVAPTYKTRMAAGQLLEAEKKLDLAAVQYEEALKLKKNDPEALYRLAILRTQLKQFEPAIDAWERYVRATRNSAIGYGNLGFCLELAGKKEEAEKAYRRGVARDPSCQLVRVNYGLMLARLDRIEEARQQLGAVLPPAHVHYNIASVYEQRGMKDKAREEYQAALISDAHFRDAKARLTALDSRE